MKESMNERIVQIAILTIVNYLHSHLKNYHTEASPSDKDWGQLKRLYKVYVIFVQERVPDHLFHDKGFAPVRIHLLP